MRIDDFIFELRRRASQQGVIQHELRGIATLFNHGTGVTSFDVTCEGEDGKTVSLVVSDDDFRCTTSCIDEFARYANE